MALVEAIVKSALEHKRQSFVTARERVARQLDQRQPIAARIVRLLPDNENEEHSSVPSEDRSGD